MDRRTQHIFTGIVFLCLSILLMGTCLGQCTDSITVNRIDSTCTRIEVSEARFMKMYHAEQSLLEVQLVLPGVASLIDSLDEAHIEALSSLMVGLNAAQARAEVYSRGMTDCSSSLAAIDLKLTKANSRIACLKKERKWYAVGGAASVTLLTIIVRSLFTGI